MSEFARANLFLHLFGGADIEGDAGDPVRSPAAFLITKLRSLIQRTRPLGVMIRYSSSYGRCA